MFAIIKKTNFFYGLILAVIFWGLLGANHAFAFSSGEDILFNVDSSYDFSGRTLTKATLRQVSEKGLFYVEDDWWDSVANQEDAQHYILSLASEFDQVIYPRLTKVYGSEWLPGIDNESRVTILITEMRGGAGGYFNFVDELPKIQMANSNEREMIYLNAAFIGSSRVKSFLAHEFQHMITYNQKNRRQGLNEDVWLNEARSEYAITLCGYDDNYPGSNLQKRVAEFLRGPSDSLTEWTNQPEDYGVVNLFMQYLVGRYGQGILGKMTTANGVGAASLEAALWQSGYRNSFPEVFADWVVATYLNDCRYGEGQKYCYANSLLTGNRLRVEPTVVSNLLASDNSFLPFSENIKDWSGHWHELLPDSAGYHLVLAFSEREKTNFKIPILIFYNDGRLDIRFLSLGDKKQIQENILNFDRQIKKVVLMPISQVSATNFLNDEPMYNFSYIAKLTASPNLGSSLTINSEPILDVASKLSSNFPDGSLIRAKNSSRVYIIKGSYRRWIQSPEIFNAYSHFGWQNIIEVSQAELDSFQEVWLIRAEGDLRVYEINGDGTKHWLNMGADNFSNSGRQWNMVYAVNRAERDWYKTGAEVRR